MFEHPPVIADAAHERDERFEGLLTTGDADAFFSQALDLATTDIEAYSRFAREFFESHKDNIPDDSKFTLLKFIPSRVAFIEKQPDAESRRGELLEQLKEVKEYFGHFTERADEVGRLAQRAWDDVKNRQEEVGHNDQSEKTVAKETAELEKSLDTVWRSESESNKGKLLDTYLHVQGEFPAAYSAEVKVLSNEDRKDFLKRKNTRLHELSAPSETAKEEILKRLKHVLETSHDPQEIQRANTENLGAAQRLALSNGDLLHGASARGLDQILESGLLCQEVTTPSRNSAGANWGSVSFGRQSESNLPPEIEVQGKKLRVSRAKYQEKISNPLMFVMEQKSLGRYLGNVAHQYGAGDFRTQYFLAKRKWPPEDMAAEERTGLEQELMRMDDAKTLAEDGVTFIVRGQKEEFLLAGGNLHHSHSDEYAVPFGVASTEIKGIVLNAKNENVLRDVMQRLAEHPFFIPIYDVVTGQLLNEEMKKLFPEAD